MLKRLSILMMMFILAACGSSSDDDDTQPPEVQFSASQTFQVELNGKQEVPMSGSSQTATATVELDETLKQIRASIDTSEIEGFSAAHIHAGGIGLNGEVAFAFADAGSGMYEVEATAVSDALISDLLAGLWYINVHTEAFENGEIRGQIVDNNVSIITFKLSGSQEVPAVTSSAMGYGYATYNSATTDLVLRAVTVNADTATAAHIHTGRIGTNGDVFVGLVQDTANMDTWATPEGTQIDSETLEVLLSGGHYVNVHTPENESGEIRGQILTDNFALATFKLEGGQEVPRLETMASGDGYALVDTTDYSVELKVVTQGVADATAAHIHTGRVGENGAVLAALTQSSMDENVWMSETDLAIDADTFAVLASGGHYVNVHTPANESGELRGQILTDNYAIATFNLSGSQEAPAITTNSKGDGYALVNTNDYSVEVKVITDGVEGATAAHIHTGRIGENGDVLAALVQSETDANVWMSPADLAINADIFAELASGGHYVNVHTPTFESGEIRGQILTSNYVLVTYSLTGDQEVPVPAATTATGDGYTLVNTNDYSVELKLVTTGVEDATAAHIHTGRVGENGPILATLVQSETDANIWMNPEGLAIDAETFAVLASGGHYVNVHTPTFENGEIRGQIITDDYVLVTFDLSGDQEVPPVVTSASGSGYALVNTTSYELELRVHTDGLTATAAHIHTGNAGENGPVLQALVQDSVNTELWLTPVDFAINADIFAVLAAGGHYVNVHTDAFANGEIRGQIE